MLVTSSGPPNVATPPVTTVDRPGVLAPASTSIATDENLSFIRMFLSELKCDRYLQTFVNFGITTASDIQYVDREILAAMGVNKIGDRLRILRKAKSLKYSSLFGSDSTPDRETQLNHLNDIIGKLNSLTTTESPKPETKYQTAGEHEVIFILNDSTTKKINVSGCFNADTIKKRLLKNLPTEQLVTNSQGAPSYTPSDYEVFVIDYTKNSSHLLYDVELVTICHSNDRMEKNRLIFVAKGKAPSKAAIYLSEEIYNFNMKMHQKGSLSSSTKDIESGFTDHARTGEPTPEVMGFPDGADTEEDKMHTHVHSVFDQRPPTELISTNLAAYVPKTDINRLRGTLRESYRNLVMINGFNPQNVNPESNGIGDVLSNQFTNSVDTTLLHNMSSGAPGGSLMESLLTGVEPEDDSIALPTEEDTDNLPDGNSSSSSGNADEEDDIISLPTKMVAPQAWLKGARIGSGSFGNVYLGMNAHTGELMAVKQVNILPNILLQQGSTEERNKYAPLRGKTTIQNSKRMVDALQHEMNLLKELHHENIVRYYGSSQEGDNLNIFLEYVPGGSVASMLNNYGPFEESLVVNFTRQVLIGLAYLHGKNIIHRDIKGANILIDTKGRVKITDFGISKKLSPLTEMQQKRASMQGSVYWMAPEVVKQTATTSKVDIWSTGCVVVEMFTGKHPYPDFTQMQAIFKIGSEVPPEIPSWASAEASKFLKLTFTIDYKERPSATDLLQNPWIDNPMLVEASKQAATVI